MKNLVFTALSTTVIAFGSLAIAPNANALEVFSGAKVGCEAGEFSGTVECQGVFSGNDSNQINDRTELFDLTGWEELTKIDGSSGSNDVVTVSSLGRGNYSWAFKDNYDLSNISDLFFSVKGGPSFSAYLWDGETKSGTFNTQGIVKGNGRGGPDLSHISFYYRNEVYRGAAPVPSPAAVLPVLGGLFGFAAKRKQENALNESDSQST